MEEEEASSPTAPPRQPPRATAGQPPSLILFLPSFWHELNPEPYPSRSKPYPNRIEPYPFFIYFNLGSLGYVPGAYPSVPAPGTYPVPVRSHFQRTRALELIRQ